MQHELGLLLGNLNRALVQRRRAQPGGLAPADFATLMALIRNPNARSGDLAIDLGMDASTMSRRICSLEERGLIERDADPADGRASIVRLTESGVAAADAEAAGRVREISEALTAWDAADVSELTRLVRQLNEAFQQSQRGERS